MSKTIVMRCFAIGVTLFLFFSAIYNNNVNAADNNWGRIIGYVRDAKTGNRLIMQTYF